MRDYSPIQRGELVEECHRKDAEIERLRAINAVLVEALRPFAEAINRAEVAEPESPENRLVNCSEDVTLYEFAKARAAIAKAKGEA